MKPRTIRNHFDDVIEIRQSEIIYPAMLYIWCGKGPLTFSFHMTPEQARAMAAALIESANEIELAKVAP